MGARRDDVTSSQRTRIAVEVLSVYRPWGTVTNLAREYGVERQTIYDMAEAGEQVLMMGLKPGPHGPQVAEKTILVNRNRLVRGTTVLTERGVSQRGVSFCLEELLDTRMSPSWVNAELAKVEEKAAAISEKWQPAVKETLSGDEIYSNDSPNLMVVGNDSLYIYVLTRQPTCDGEMWGCILLEFQDCSQFASDGGTCLAAGVKVAGIGHQLNWDHLLRPMWGQVSRLEKQAYAALEAVEARAAKLEQTNTPKRLEQHWTAWERLIVEAGEKIVCHDAFLQIARQVDDWFALVDLKSGQLRDSLTGAKSLRNLGKQLQGWIG